MAYARPIAFIILAVITAYGLYRFFAGDWSDVTAYWRQNLIILPLLCLVSVVDVALEAIAWMWVYKRLHIKAFDRGGACAFVAGRAGLPLPAQLGRLIRPDAMTKLRRAPMMECLKAEGVVFVLDSISVVALLGGLLAFKYSALLAPVAAVLVITVFLVMGNFICTFVTHTRLQLPTKFWWAPATITIILIDMTGWLAHGLALHVVVGNLPGDVTLWDSLFLGPGAAVLGVGTGLPGGIGATEGILGVSLGLKNVPVEHLTLAIAAFRLITFWVWIPIGWLALTLIRRHKCDDPVPV